MLYLKAFLQKRKMIISKCIYMHLVNVLYFSRNYETMNRNNEIQSGFNANILKLIKVRLKKIKCEYLYFITNILIFQRFI